MICQIKIQQNNNFFKMEVRFYRLFKDDKFKKMNALEVGSSLGHTTRVMSFLLIMLHVGQLRRKTCNIRKDNKDRDNITFRVWMFTMKLGILKTWV